MLNSEPIGRRRTELPNALRQFVVQSAIWVGACLTVELFCHFVLRLSFPYDWPGMQRWSQFIDTSDFVPKFRYYHHLAFFSNGERLMYPAPVVLAYKLICFHGHLHTAWYVTRRFLIVIVLGALLLLAGLRPAFIRRRLTPHVATFFLLACFTLSYPFWFEFSRANMEFVVWILMSLGVYLFCRGRNWGAGALFGIAASMKIFPFVFLGLLISRRQYRQAAFGIAVAAITTLASLWLLYPNISVSLHETAVGVNTFREIYMLHIRPVEIGFDHSLFALFKRLLPVLPSPEAMEPLLSAYLAIVATVGVILYFVRIRHLPIINQVTCLTVCSILLPPTSYDYTLLHLYAPWAMLMLLCLSCAQRGTEIRHRTALGVTVACYALLMTPQSELIWHAERFGGQIKAVVLLLLLYTALRYPTEGCDGVPEIPLHPSRPTHQAQDAIRASGQSLA